MSLAGGIMKNPNPNTEIRINDRFFLGGPLTLRGFNTKGVGPHSEGESSGQRPSYIGHCSDHRLREELLYIFIYMYSVLPSKLTAKLTYSNLRYLTLRKTLL